VEPAAPLVGPEDLGEPWFNRVIPYFAIPLLFLTGAGPIIAWRRANFSNFRKAFIIPINLALLATAVTIWLFHARAAHHLTDRGLTFPEATRIADLDVRVLLVFFAGFFVLFTIMMEYVRAIRIRRKKMGGNPFWHAIILTLKARRRFGGYIVHVGIVMCFFAFAGSAVKTYIPDQVMYPGYSVDLDQYRVTLSRIDEVYVANGDYVASRATMVVTDRGQEVNKSTVDQLENVLNKYEFSPIKARIIDGSPKVHLFFSDETDRQRFLAASLIQTELSRNYEYVKEDTAKSAHVYRFKHAKVLEHHPRSFMRHVRAMKAYVSALSNLGVRPQFTPGSVYFSLSFANPESLRAFDEVRQLANDLPQALYAQFGDAPNEVEIIPVGAGRLLVPEVRFYTKHETPTTEVATEAHLFDELYLSMRPAMGREFISISGFVNPLVSFLWFGSLILVIGALIALLPDWAVSFIRRPNRPSGDQSFHEPKKQTKIPQTPSTRGSPLPGLLVFIAAGLTLLVGFGLEGVRAQDSVWKKSHQRALAQIGIQQTPKAANRSEGRGRVFDDMIACPDRARGSWTVRDGVTLGACATQEATLVRDVLQSVLSRHPGWDVGKPSGRLSVLKELVLQDGRIDRLLRVDSSKFDSIWRSAKCLCGCGTHILFQCGPECGPKERWRQHFRLMLCSGFSVDQVLEHYRTSHKKDGGGEYTKEEMLKDPDKKKQSWAIPALFGAILVGFIFFSLLRRPRTGRSGPEDTHGTPGSWTSKDALPPDDIAEDGVPNPHSEEIDDLLEDIEDPLS
jgi:hypothetical protein